MPCTRSIPGSLNAGGGVYECARPQLWPISCTHSPIEDPFFCQEKAGTELVYTRG